WKGSSPNVINSPFKKKIKKRGLRCSPLFCLALLSKLRTAGGRAKNLTTDAGVRPGHARAVRMRAGQDERRSTVLRRHRNVRRLVVARQAGRDRAGHIMVGVDEIRLLGDRRVVQVGLDLRLEATTAVRGKLRDRDRGQNADDSDNDQ